LAALKKCRSLGDKMNNEPVAWMDEDENVVFEKCKVYPIPLYTHPVKELTDEEIRHIQAICHLKNVGYDNFIMRFARAILRKAQEK
jgi:hypothetical protein